MASETLCAGYVSTPQMIALGVDGDRGGGEEGGWLTFPVLAEPVGRCVYHNLIVAGLESHGFAIRVGGGANEGEHFG